MGKFLNKVTTLLLALTLIVTSGIFNATPAKAATVPLFEEQQDLSFVSPYKSTVPTVYDSQGNPVTKHSDFVLGELYTVAGHTWMAVADHADENYIVLQGIDFGASVWPGLVMGLVSEEAMNKRYEHAIGDISNLNEDFRHTYDELIGIEKVISNKTALSSGIAYFNGLYLICPGPAPINTEESIEYSHQAADMAIEYCIENNADMYWEEYTDYTTKEKKIAAYAWGCLSHSVPYIYKNKTYNKVFTIVSNRYSENCKFALSPCFNLDTSRLSFQESTDIKITSRIDESNDFWNELIKNPQFANKYIKNNSNITPGIYAGYDMYPVSELFKVEYTDGSNKRRPTVYSVSTDSEYCSIRDRLCIPDATEDHVVTFTIKAANGTTKTKEVTILHNIDEIKATVSSAKVKSGGSIDLYNSIRGVAYIGPANQKTLNSDVSLDSANSLNKDDYIITVETPNGGTVENGIYTAPRVNSTTTVTLAITDKQFGLKTTFPVTIEAKPVRKNSEASTEYQEYSDNGDCEVYTSIASMFMVTIPKKIVLDGKTKAANYTVNVTGDIAGNELVNVVPDESFTLTEKGGKADKTAVVTQGKTTFTYDDIYVEGGHTENGSVAAPITAGTWSGTFDFNIYLNDK